MSEPQYQVVSPEGRSAQAPMRSTAPLSVGTARRVGFVWDYVFRGDDIFQILAGEFHATDPELSFVGHEAFGDIHGRDEASVVARLPDRLRAERVDSVIVGVGA